MSRKSTILAFMLIAGGCTGTVGPVPSSVLLTQGAGLAADDDIDGLDVATETSGAVDVVWLERANPHVGSSRERIVLRRGTGTPLRWGPRVEVTSGGTATGAPKVVAAADGIHVFAGRRLRHWWRPAGNAAFIDVGAALSERGPVADAFDAIAMGDGIVIAYTPPYASGDATVYGVRLDAGGRAHPLTMATFPPGRAAGSAQLVLRAYGPRLMLLWTNTGFFDVFAAKPGVIPVANDATAAYAAWSDDGGASWTQPNQIATDGADTVRALALGGILDAPLVYIASSGLFASPWSAKGISAPLRVAAYQPGTLSGSRDTSAVATSPCGVHAVVAWVDSRNRRSDRRWWNPLGGFPWGDNPDWDNNDLFVALDVPRSAKDAAALSPLRLTAPGSMTKDIAAVERGGQLLLFRTGRARVRKAPNDAGAPPEVTQSTVPCR